MCPGGYKGEVRAKFTAKSIPRKLSAGTSLCLGSFGFFLGQSFLVTVTDVYRWPFPSWLLVSVVCSFFIYMCIFLWSLFMLGNSQYLLARARVFSLVMLYSATLVVWWASLLKDCSVCLVFFFSFWSRFPLVTCVFCISFYLFICAVFCHWPVHRWLLMLVLLKFQLNSVLFILFDPKCNLFSELSLVYCYNCFNIKWSAFSLFL